MASEVDIDGEQVQGILAAVAAIVGTACAAIVGTACVAAATINIARARGLAMAPSSRRKREADV
jgi:hypothetical protein